MILTYHGGTCIRASAGDMTIVFGPVSKNSKNFKPTNFGADAAFISFNHQDMNGAEEAGRGDKQPIAILGPGEYEVSAKGASPGGKDPITAMGFPSTSSYDGDRKTNTIYSVHFDGLHILYLGAQGSAVLPKEVLEMDSPDILIIPIGGGGALSPSEAQKLSVMLEARIVIPILWNEKTLKQFLKEASAEGAKPADKLTLRPRDVAGKENEVIVLGI